MIPLVSRMNRPTVEAITTDSGDKMWRVCYGGLCREHKQEWQATIYLEIALAMFRSDLHRAAQFPRIPGL